MGREDGEGVAAAVAAGVAAGKAAAVVEEKAAGAGAATAVLRPQPLEPRLQLLEPSLRTNDRRTKHRGPQFVVMQLSHKTKALWSCGTR